MENNCWLPNLEFFEDYNSEWAAYQNALYTIFKKDFIDSRPSFKGIRVSIRKHPVEYGKEEAFFHVTCQDYNGDGERAPDFRRCERIRWVKSFIEEHNCDSSACAECDGIKLWEEPAPRGSYKRVHLLLEEERYMVVVEPRDSYCLLITAFYFEQDHSLRKKLQHYAEYSNS
ncbi:hypothetical protein [Gudongella oleilytica]|uniref:hypothetical protein n=1 Tax=Gudongella oleilytica TaxID=1582259 RepID=UPI000FF88A89|nr:hypothetical protein [Gudongella oleilytica]